MTSNDSAHQRPAHGNPVRFAESNAMPGASTANADRAGERYHRRFTAAHAELDTTRGGLLQPGSVLDRSCLCDRCRPVRDDHVELHGLLVVRQPIHHSVVVRL